MLVRPIALALLLATSAACSEDAPPFDELALRDALQASPSAVASLPLDARRSLASRLRDARQEQAAAAAEAALSDPGEVGAALDPAAVEAMILEIDRSREDEGHDALVSAALDLAPPSARLLAPPARVLAQAAEVGASPPAVLEGSDPSSPTSKAEARALAGEAGLVVADLAEQSGAGRFVRVSGWPVGAVAAGGSVYVNATWLVAMAGAEDEGTLHAPPLMTQDAPGNPYDPPASLSACVMRVTSDCEACVASNACEDSLLSDLSAQAACTFLLEDPARFDRLCVIAILDIQSIAECMQRTSPSCIVPSTANTSSNLGTVANFVADESCTSDLDYCLDKSRSPPGGGSSGGSGSASVCTVEGSGSTPGRKALLLFGPLLFVLFLGRLGRRGSWNAR